MTRFSNAAELSLMKHGNCIWVPCPECAESFPVSPEIHNQNNVAMHCPDCGHNFYSPTPTNHAITKGDS